MLPFRSSTPGPIEIKSVAGFREATVKKLNGAKFKMPSLLFDETHAIGLGITEPINNLYISSSLKLTVLKVSICSLDIYPHSSTVNDSVLYRFYYRMIIDLLNRSQLNEL